MGEILSGGSLQPPTTSEAGNGGFRGSEGIWGGSRSSPPAPRAGVGAGSFARLPFVKQQAAPGRQESWVIYCFIS